jgi:hypothetical protein
LNSQAKNIAQRLDLKYKQLPLLPNAELVSHYSTLCIIYRVKELLSFWVEEEIEFDHCVITCSKELSDRTFLPVSLDGVRLNLIVDQYHESVVLGTFTVEIVSNDPKAIFVNNGIGISYQEPVSHSYHQSRWVLQEIDGNSPLISHNIAFLL